MLRRVIDLTQTVRPINDYQRDYPPPWSDFEATGPERKRTEMQKLVRVEPFHLDGHPDELMMNVTLGHSTGHTHVDVFLHDWETMYEDLPRKDQWTRRDVSQVPSHELIGPAAVVDLSEAAPYGKIDLAFFQEKARHVQRGDIVLIKSGHPAAERRGEGQAGDFTVLPPEAAAWLAREKQVRVCGFDHKINGNFPIWSRTEKAFYRHGVLMIDRMANLDDLQAGERYFACVGVSLKVAGCDDSPARAFVIDKLSDLGAGGRATDLFYPIACDWNCGAFPFARAEPYALKAQIMRRMRLENVHITQTEYDDLFGGPGFMGYKRFCNFVGTHIQVPSYPLAGLPADPASDLGSIDTANLWGRCVCVDAWDAGPGQDVTADMLRRAPIEAGDIVLLRTSYCDYYAQSPDYLFHSPGLSDGAVQWLIEKRVKMVVADFAGVECAGSGGRIGAHDHLKALFASGVLAVTDACGMWRVAPRPGVAFISPMAFPGLNASPCRVLVYEEYQ